MFRRFFGNRRVVAMLLLVGGVAGFYYLGRLTAPVVHITDGVTQEDVKRLITASDVAAAANLATVQSKLDEANRKLFDAEQRLKAIPATSAPAPVAVVATPASAPVVATPAPAPVVATPAPAPAPVVKTPATPTIVEPIFVAPHDSVWMAAHGWRWVAVVVDGRNGKSWYCDPPKGKQTDGSCG